MSTAPARATRRPVPDADGSMYQPREKVYPREVSGRYQRLRKLAVIVLLGLYYALPWLRWDGRQAVLFDLPAREFHILGLTFWPQDFIYLSLLLIIAALTLFWVTALAGRVWCGYACPQTVWTELFMWIERWCEGDRPKRMKLDRAGWSWDKLRRKSAKHSLWIVLAAWTGFTFVGFFTPIHELGAQVTGLSLGGWEAFWMCFYGFATWGNAGFMRENVCLYMCPYARFQSAMFDRDTLIISYDRERGEPRGGRKRSADRNALGLGDCIDCTLCVQACPTGIDIRDGLQYECIACGACVDVCNQVMDKMGYPRGLIRYTTENALNHKPTRILRPRVIVYGLILLTLAAAFATGIALRTPARLDILPDRNALYRQLEAGLVENVYTLKLMNMDRVAHTFVIEADGIQGLSVETEPPRITVEPGSLRNVPTRIRVDTEGVRGGGHDIRLTAKAIDSPEIAIVEPTRFHTPVRR